MCSEALYSTTWLSSRRSYIVPEMLYYRNGDASMSYHMLLYRTRCCYIVTSVLSYRNGDAIISYHMLLYRTRCCHIVPGVLLYRSSDAVSSYQMLLYRTPNWSVAYSDNGAKLISRGPELRLFLISLLVKPCIDLCRQVEIFKLMYVFLSSKNFLESRLRKK